MYMNIRLPLVNTALADFDTQAKSAGMEIHAHSTFCEIERGKDAIRIGHKHHSYVPDIIHDFDFYFDAVEPVPVGDKMVVDYSMARFHKVRGFDLMPVMFNGFAEPLETTHQYLDIAKIPQDAVVLDLGGYSGLTSMLFALEAGRNGRVICIEPDKYNIATIRTNIDFFAKLGQDAAPITLEESAVWSHGNGITFSTEGNMGSMVRDVSVNDYTRGEGILVPTLTLSDIARKYALERVDFIKCDVEGAEVCLFEGEAEFLKKFKPTIILESHWVQNGKRMSTEIFGQHLRDAGYNLTEIAQKGVPLPLILAEMPMAASAAA